MLPLQDKVILITGATRGWGAFAAERLARCGCRVILNYAHKSADAAALAEKITLSGGAVDIFRADAADGEEAESLFQNLAECFENVDVLINAAKVSGNPERDLQEQIDADTRVCLPGVFWCCKYFLEHFTGRIVNVSVAPDSGDPASAAVQEMTSAGIHALTRFFAEKYPSSPINTFFPGAGSAAYSDAAFSALLQLLTDDGASGRRICSQGE